MARAERLQIINQLENQRTKVISYITGDRQGFETKIAFDVLPLLYKHLRRIGKVRTIMLFLYSTGGLTMAGWRIVTLIREFCNKFIVLVPYKAQSCATLIALGADEIIMGPIGQLSPVDPTVTTPYNPPAPTQIPGLVPTLLPVSVEDVISYLNLAKEGAKLEQPAELKEVFLRLTGSVNPLALGNVHRARSQIRMLAEKLLKSHMKGRNIDKKIANIVSTLTEKLFSHDYLISRKEAKEILGSIVKEPQREMEKLVWDLFQDYSQEIGLGNIFNHNIFLGNLNERELQLDRAFVESTYGLHVFRTRKIIRRRQVATQIPGQVMPGISGQPIQTEIFEERVLQEEWVETEWQQESQGEGLI
jgi:hypothetical protein